MVEVFGILEVEEEVFSIGRSQEVLYCFNMEVEEEGIVLCTGLCQVTLNWISLEAVWLKLLTQQPDQPYAITLSELSWPSQQSSFANSLSSS